MPIWLQILIQVVETVLQDLIKNQPGPNATIQEQDDHAAHISRVEEVLTRLKV